jgi:hypothetical protein
VTIEVANTTETNTTEPSVTVNEPPTVSIEAPAPVAQNQAEEGAQGSAGSDEDDYEGDSQDGSDEDGEYKQPAAVIGKPFIYIKHNVNSSVCS